MKRLILLFLLLFSFLSCSFAQSIKFIDLSTHKWEYKWGDSTFKEDIPLWSLEDSIPWTQIEYPSNPPERNGQTNVWYRVKLPDVLPKNPHLYVFSFDILPEVYLDGKKIYSFGKIDKEGKGKFLGWPWHMFELPYNSEEKYIYFRLYSDYLDIGMFGDILVGSKGNLYERFLNKDISKIVIGSISIFVSLIFLFSYLLKLKRVELFILATLFLSQGLNVLCTAKVLQIYYFYPLLNQFILAGVFFYFPLGMALFFDRTVKIKLPFNIMKRVWQVHLVYFVGALAGAYIGFYDIPSAYAYFDIIYYIFTLPILTVCMIYFFFIGDNYIKLVSSSFLIISIYWVYSFLVAYHVVPWTEYPSDLAVFICLIILAYSIIKRINYTNDLEEEKEHLFVLSSTDYLTKVYNRKELDKMLKNNEALYKRYKNIFSIILLDLDNFKQVNDTFGHLAGDKLLVDIVKVLKQNIRESDIIGRWGGEEFIIICPKTNLKETVLLAEKLRKKIENTIFDELGKRTASFGVTTYKEEDSITSLVARVDEAMYLSKSKGRNKVSSK